MITKDAVSNFSAQIKIHIENSIKVRSTSIVSQMILKFMNFFNGTRKVCRFSASGRQEEQKLREIEKGIQELLPGEFESQTEQKLIQGKLITVKSFRRISDKPIPRGRMPNNERPRSGSRSRLKSRGRMPRPSSARRSKSRANVRFDDRPRQFQPH